MQLTWLAIAASLCMAFGAALLFYYAVKKDWLKDIEGAKYQVFWSDLDQLVDIGKDTNTNTSRSSDGDQSQKKR